MSPSPKNDRRRPPHWRRGTAVLIAIVALTLALGAGGALVKTALLRQEQLRMRHRQLQARSLADSALDRAAARLRRDRAYRGEQWRVPLPSAAAQGVVRITVLPLGSAQVVRVSAVADVPDDPVDRVRVRRERVIELSLIQELRP